MGFPFSVAIKGGSQGKIYGRIGKYAGRAYDAEFARVVQIETIHSDTISAVRVTTRNGYQLGPPAVPSSARHPRKIILSAVIDRNGNAERFSPVFLFHRDDILDGVPLIYAACFLRSGVSPVATILHPEI